MHQAGRISLVLQRRQTVLSWVTMEKKSCRQSQVGLHWFVCFTGFVRTFGCTLLRHYTLPWYYDLKLSSQFGHGIQTTFLLIRHSLVSF